MEHGVKVSMNNRIGEIFDSQHGVTLMEVLVTLVILCLFAVVFTQMIGISFKDIFFKGNKMEATAAAQNVMEKITAVAAKYSDDSFDENVSNLDECLVVDSEEDLLVYDPNYNAQIFITRPVSKSVSGVDPVKGMDISVVVFYNNGTSFVRIDNFLETG